MTAVRNRGKQGGGSKQQPSQQQQQAPPQQPANMLPGAKAAKKKALKGKKAPIAPATLIAGCALLLLSAVLAYQWYLTGLPEPAQSEPLVRPPKTKTPKRATESRGSAEKRHSLEWQTLSRDLPSCLTLQEELMTIPVNWPGFHAFCIDAVSGDSITLAVHNKSGAAGDSGTRLMRAEVEEGSDVFSSLLELLQAAHAVLPSAARSFPAPRPRARPQPWPTSTAGPLHLSPASGLSGSPPELRAVLPGLQPVIGRAT